MISLKPNKSSSELVSGNIEKNRRGRVMSPCNNVLQRIYTTKLYVCLAMNQNRLKFLLVSSIILKTKHFVSDLRWKKGKHQIVYGLCERQLSKCTSNKCIDELEKHQCLIGCFPIFLIKRSYLRSTFGITCFLVNKRFIEIKI